jgi:MOSC domain-containing protein
LCSVLCNLLAGNDVTLTTSAKSEAQSTTLSLDLVMNIGVIKEIWRYPVKSMAGERLETCRVDQLGLPGDRGWALRDETTGEITNGKRFPLLMQCAARYRTEPAGTSIPQADMLLPDGSSVSSDDPQVNARLSELLAKPVTLWPRVPPENLEHYRRKSKAARVFGKLAKFRPFRSALPTLASFGNANAELREVFSREPNEPVPDISTLPPELMEFTSPPGTYFDAFTINVLTTASLAIMSRLNPSAIWDSRRFRPNFLIETNETQKGLVESEWNGRRLRLGDVELLCAIPTVRCGMTTHAQKDLPKDPSVLRSIVKDADQNLGSYANVIKTGEVKLGDQVELMSTE